VREAVVIQTSFRQLALSGNKERRKLRAAVRVHGKALRKQRCCMRQRGRGSFFSPHGCRARGKVSAHQRYSVENVARKPVLKNQGVHHILNELPAGYDFDAAIAAQRRRTGQEARKNPVQQE